MLYNDFGVELVFYVSVQGREPVRESIADLAKSDRAKVFSYLERLKQEGRSLGEPIVKSLQGKLKELRFRITQGQYRVFFFFHQGGRVILLHSMVKKTEQTPKRDLDLAQSRMRDWLKRREM